MKKSLIALAALAAVGAVSAQSSVTMYGTLDLGSMSNKNTTDTTTFSAAGAVTGTGSVTTKTTQLAGMQDGRSTSKLGFRGSEDLGGGLRANFQLETGIGADNNVAGVASSMVAGGTRLALIQLAGDFGAVTIGTYNNLIDEGRGYSAGSFNMAGGDYFAKSVRNPAGLDGRSQNALAYKSPVFGGGFTFGIGVTNQRTQTDTAAAAGTTNVNVRTRGFIAGLSYNNGPLRATLAHGSATGTNSTVAPAPAVPAAGEGKVRDTIASVSYNFGFVIPYVMYERARTTVGGATAAAAFPGAALNAPFVVAAPGTGGNLTARSFEIGAKFPLGAFTPYVLAGRGRHSGGTSTIAGATATNDARTRAYQIGTTYDLSKRTYVYAAIGRDRIASSSTAVATGVRTDINNRNTGYMIGVQHSF